MTTSNKAGRLLQALLAVLLVVSLGCASGGGDAPAPPVPASSTQVTQPAEIRSLDLREDGDVAFLEVVADRALVWTNYRDSSGNLVVELPNSVPAASVENLATAEGLVASVEIEQLDDAERPLTRLVVRTREDSEHSLTTEGEILRLQLLPAGYEEPVALAYEPVGGTGARPAADAGFGTPDAPVSGPPTAGVAASRLYSVEARQVGASTVVEVHGDGEFAYSMFQLPDPPRFVVDLTGVVNTSSARSVEVDSDLVNRIRVGQFKPQPDAVSRVVFDLNRDATPRIERTTDGLIITFGAPAGQETTLAQDVGTPGSEPTEVAQAEPEEFEPSYGEPDAGEPEPSYGEPDAGEPVPIYEPEPVAVAEGEGGEPPSGEPPLFEPADTSEGAGEPAYGEPDDPSAAPVAEYEPIEVEPPDDDSMPPPFVSPTQQPPPPLPQPTDVAAVESQEIDVTDGFQEEEPLVPNFDAVFVNRREREYIGEPINMSLKNADLVETLRTFAAISGLNFVIQPGVGGAVTVELKGVPWDQAMEQILRINNLGMEIDGTIVRIAPAEMLRKEVEEEAKMARERAANVQLRTVMKSLSYAQASAVATLLRNQTGSILSERGTVQVDPRTNTLILREVPSNIDTVLAVIENLDAPVAQVNIEARIIEATKTFANTLGIEWGYDLLANNANGNTTGLQFPNNIDSDGGVGLLTGGANGFLNLSMGNILNTFNLNARLQAAESEGLINVVSAPRVTTLDNFPATIQSGLQIPVQTVSNRTVSVQFVNATLQLTVIPHVTAEGTVILALNVAKRSPQLAFAIVGASNAPIATKEATTTVIVRDGGTAVIGGIYEVSHNQNQDRVPGLSNIPVIGHLFKNRSRNEDNNELMIFVTPRIVQM